MSKSILDTHIEIRYPTPRKARPSKKTSTLDWGNTEGLFERVRKLLGLNK